jgi:hypothetical protein
MKLMQERGGVIDRLMQKLSPLLDTLMPRKIGPAIGSAA